MGQSGQTNNRYYIALINSGPREMERAGLIRLLSQDAPVGSLDQHHFSAAVVSSRDRCIIQILRLEALTSIRWACIAFRPARKYRTDLD